MKSVFSILMFMSFLSQAHAFEMTVIPQVMDAIRSYTQDEPGFLPLSPSIARTRNLLKESKVSKSFLEQKLQEYDFVKMHQRLADIPDIQLNTKELKQKMAIAFEASKITVLEESDDWTGDDLYAYFIITDGFVPSAKITQTYKNLSASEAFFLDITDRKLFPREMNSSKALANHLIIDMGIVESDGDDIKEAKKITSIIIDIALVIIAAEAPGVGTELLKLRKEIKALADFFNELNKDDRLVTDTIIMTYEDLQQMFGENSTVHEFMREYSGKDRWSDWKYRVDFRVLK